MSRGSFKSQQRKLKTLPRLKSLCVRLSDHSEKQHVVHHLYNVAELRLYYMIIADTSW